MKELRLGIAGLGTVGAGVVRLLRANADLIAARAGCRIAIKAVCARDKNRSRDCDLSGIAWVDDPLALATRADIDAVVELIGGAEGAARHLAEAALKNRKHYITANKALLATHGETLAALAEQNGVRMLFEASVAGGIPVIKALREGLAGNRISLVRGILNGTCNYILTRMYENGIDFGEALSEAQARGYAEANPSTDVDGHDTAYKLAILTSLAFGIVPDVAAIHCEGIRSITLLDLKFARELDCRVKLLGVARMTPQGIEQRVGPCLVPYVSPLTAVNGAMNAVFLRGDFVGDLLLQGQGAGGAPTASAVAADIIDLAHSKLGQPLGVPVARLRANAAVPAHSPARYYVRLQVVDKPGVVADISAILRDEAISIESLLQRGRSAVDSVPLVITTHAAPADAMRRASEKLTKLTTVEHPPCLMPIED